MATITTFKDRAQPAEVFAVTVFDALAELGFVVAQNGTEHTHPTFVKHIHESVDTTSVRIRYEPDGVIATNDLAKRSAYVEAKLGNSIQREAYENYMRIYQEGSIVAVVIGAKCSGEIVGWDEVQELILHDGSETCRWKSPETNKVWEFPVCEGWVTPRKHPEWRAAKTAGGFRGSGTAYRFIKTECLRPWSEFFARVCGKLAMQSA